jgi:hypothetical protein
MSDSKERIGNAIDRPDPLPRPSINHVPYRSRPQIGPRRWDATIKALKSYRGRRYQVKPKLYNTQQ